MNEFCPFCCSKYGTRSTCDANCHMWEKGECVIKEAFKELSQNIKRLNNE
jgi:predicted metal-binding protein